MTKKKKSLSNEKPLEEETELGKMWRFGEISDAAYKVIVHSAFETIDDIADHYNDADYGGILKVLGVGKKIHEEFDTLIREHGKKWKVRKK